MDTQHIRPPLQDRSRLSLLKVLAAARTLLTESGSPDFTLAEVSKLSGVSIGSIYGRFKGKDDLCRAVLAEALEQMDREWTELAAELKSRPSTLQDRIPALIEALGEFLARHAAILRPFMNRADQLEIARSGKVSHAKMAASCIEVIAIDKQSIRHPDPDHAIETCFRITYSAFARFLGLGSSASSAGEGDWSSLKLDLGRMCVLFLTTP